MNFNLIRYIPSGSTSCRGCTMSQWDSDFEIFFHEDKVAFIEKFAYVMYLDIISDRKNPEYQVMIDGFTRDNIDYDDEFRLEIHDDIWTKSQKLADEKVSAYKAQQELASHKKKEAIEHAEKHRKLLQYEQLKKELGFDRI